MLLEPIKNHWFGFQNLGGGIETKSKKMPLINRLSKVAKS